MPKNDLSTVPIWNIMKEQGIKSANRHSTIALRDHLYDVAVSVSKCALGKAKESNSPVVEEEHVKQCLK